MVLQPYFSALMEEYLRGMDLGCMVLELAVVMVDRAEFLEEILEDFASPRYKILIIVSSNFY